MDRVLTVSEMGEWLQVSKPVAYRIANQPDFPAVHIGRAIRIPEAAFMRWLEKQTEGKA